mmetsp:Transcript_17669/g.51428  ORF Transcript_17669/g.51428 Transcript_17669/m.51428 type:complete len:270 (+) Transcript_17669:557-1366(+)
MAYIDPEFVCVLGCNGTIVELDRCPVHNGRIRLFHYAVLELPRKLNHCGFRFRYEEQARRRLIEAVHRRRTSNDRKSSETRRRQRIRRRRPNANSSRPTFPVRVHIHTARFVHDCKMVVLVHDGKFEGRLGAVVGGIKGVAQAGLLAHHVVGINAILHPRSYAACGIKGILPPGFGVDTERSPMQKYVAFAQSLARSRDGGIPLLVDHHQTRCHCDVVAPQTDPFDLVLTKNLSRERHIEPLRWNDVLIHNKETIRNALGQGAESCVIF